jgi:hypothetical protein
MKNRWLFILMFGSCLILSATPAQAEVTTSIGEFDAYEEMAIGSVIELPEVQDFTKQLHMFEHKLRELSSEEQTIIFGSPKNMPPKAYVRPIFAPRSFTVGGVGFERFSKHSFYIIDDIGGVEIWEAKYGEGVPLSGGTVRVALIYFKADDSYVPFHSSKDVKGCLTWDTERFQIFVSWFETKKKQTQK